MIIYFSSTGNCKFIAHSIANKLSDNAYSITEINQVNLQLGESLGLVFPTYFWRLPSIVDEYMKNLKITSKDSNPYIYFISTYGTTCGQTAAFIKRHLKKKGFNLTAAFGIKTVDDWSVWYDLTDKEKIDSILKSESIQLENVINSINSKVNSLKIKDSLPMIAVLGSNMFYNLARKTKHLNVNDNCMSCGICQNECPMSAIEIKNGKPVWIKKKCTMCLHCLHSCPKFAIQYDNKTQNNGQYKHP